MAIDIFRPLANEGNDMTSTVRDGSPTDNRFLNRIPFCVGIVWLQVMSCGYQDRDVVAEVGRYRIEAGALRSLVADLLPGQRADATGDEARRRYLQVMVDGRLMLLEAENQALESLEEVQAEIREAVDKQVRRLYLAAEIPSGPPVTEAGRQSPVRAGGVRPRAHVQRRPGCRPGNHGQRARRPGGGPPFRGSCGSLLTRLPFGSSWGRAGLRRSKDDRQTQPPSRSVSQPSRGEGVAADPRRKGRLAGIPLHRRTRRSVRQAQGFHRDSPANGAPDTGGTAAPGTPAGILRGTPECDRPQGTGRGLWPPADRGSARQHHRPVPPRRRSDRRRRGERSAAGRESSPRLRGQRRRGGDVQRGGPCALT